MNDSTIWQNELLIPCVNEKSAEIIDDVQTADLQLIKLTLAGDETAFETLFDRYKKLVAVIASRYFQSSEEIEEIIQISFTKVYFELGKFRGEHDFSMASWLGRITTNTCLDVLKKRQRKPENLLDDLSGNEKLLADIKDDSNEKKIIERDLAEKLLRHLPIADRALLQMLYTEEMSINQVSEVTGWSSAKIKVRAFRARNSLRKVLRKFV